MRDKYGGKNYSIFLDKESLTLFGYIEIEGDAPRATVGLAVAS